MKIEILFRGTDELTYFSVHPSSEQRVASFLNSGLGLENQFSFMDRSGFKVRIHPQHILYARESR